MYPIYVWSTLRICLSCAGVTREQMPHAAEWTQTGHRATLGAYMGDVALVPLVKLNLDLLYVHFLPDVHGGNLI